MQKFDCGTMVVAKDEGVEPALLIMVPFGGVPDDSLEDYCKSTWEKVKALHKCREFVRSKHVPDTHYPGRFTGAIRAGGYILAFAGLGGFYDELLMTIVAIDLGLIDEAVAIEKILRPNEGLLTYTRYKEEVWKKGSGKKRARA